MSQVTVLRDRRFLLDGLSICLRSICLVLLECGQRPRQIRTHSGARSLHIAAWLGCMSKMERCRHARASRLCAGVVRLDEVVKPSAGVGLRVSHTSGPPLE